MTIRDLLCRFAFALALLLPAAVHASGPISAAARFRALEALYFLPIGAFPAGELHWLNPGDIVDVERGTVVFGIEEGSTANECLPELRIRGPYDSTESRSGETMDAGVLLGATVPAGPAGLIEIDAEGAVRMSPSATFTVAPLAQKDPSGGERKIMVARRTRACSAYHDIFGGRFQGRVVVSRSFRGREELMTTLEIDASAKGSLKKSEILSLLETAMGVRGLPLSALSISADGRTARFAAISKPSRGELALAFVPMHLNRDEVAAIHYFLDGSNGVELRSLVDEALNSSDPGIVDRATDRLAQLFGRQLADERWARRFLEAPAEGEGTMELASEVIASIEADVPGVLENLAYYAAAVELSGGRSGIGGE